MSGYPTLKDLLKRSLEYAKRTGKLPRTGVQRKPHHERPQLWVVDHDGFFKKEPK